jgi:myo-inositol-1(or 4)-monophosphatase
MNDISELKIFAHRLALESASIIQPYFRNELNIDVKLDNSPVTIADKKAEEVMRELIFKEFPTHGIIGEEFGSFNPDSEFVWVLDPIDGTKSFISGAMSFGTLIALLKNGKPIIGVINHPILNEYLVGDNESCELNGKIVKVRQCINISRAVLLTTDHLKIAKFQNPDGFNKLINKVQMYRNWGDCYGYYLVATGFADIMIDPIMNSWDSLALIPIINGAGGVISDYQGNDPIAGNSIVAASPSLHKEVIILLNEGVNKLRSN